MKVPATLQFLGTGSSWGVPVIGCQCAVCQSAHPKNRRSRPSALLKVGSKAFLIDAGPDLREQALRYHIDHLDGLLLTHTHYDHTGGIDDLRIFYLKAKKPLSCMLSTTSASEIRTRFAYMLRPQPLEIKETPRLKLIEIGEERGERVFEGIVVRFFSYKQLEMPVFGFRFGSLAYVTDIKAYSGDVYNELAGVDTLVLSALRFTTSHMHMTIDEAVDFVRRVGPKQTFLTHTAHELDYERTNQYLPADIRMAYDGLELPFEMDVV